MSNDTNNTTIVGSTDQGSGVDNRTYRLLGVAFLIQATASAVSGLVLAPVDLLATTAPSDMVSTMADIAANEWRLRASIVGEMITAGGVVALGSLLFTVLRAHGRNVALIAFGLYVVEAAVLVVREVMVFALFWTSQEAGAAVDGAEQFTTQASMLYESQSFAYSLHTLLFAAGATMFYILFARSGVLPRPLIGLGLIAAPLALVSQTLVLFGVAVPLVFFLPNLPFELGAGLWLAFRPRPST